MAPGLPGEATCRCGFSGRGLGIIGAGDADRAWVEREIRRVREVTDRPFGVNSYDDFTSYRRCSRFGDYIGGKCRHHRRRKSGALHGSTQNAGIKVLPVVALSALARRLSRLGADALIVEGMESGGHVGEITTMCIVPMVVDPVDIPGNRRRRHHRTVGGYMAAMALGAEGGSGLYPLHLRC